ncbi:MAG TPA: putative DNA modification/repair radical SAM protein [Spirochaetales bacterium]|nr:putative DNA modification/repair radical SAM protein [Spirochaetales bacterium]HRY53648.1 putative DNA modification/repair radical SAM protein [Spirochaetia bacterium]HRZ65010.1 putative DNA modification/repair radical SAM protein [Spirochaetia bacterium]
MELADKLALLAGAARYDASCASSGSSRGAGPGGIGASSPAGVCHSWTGDGRCVSLLKLLYSNACRNDCAYCASRSSADTRRASFSPEELVRITMAFYRRNYIEGLFLSSGIFSDPDIVMERLVEVARRLREEEGFGGYIHLKVIPGSSEKLLRRAGAYADRLSANIELPTQASLSRLAPQKSGTEILGAMRLMSEAEGESREESGRARGWRRAAPPPFAPGGQSTQLVVGASPEDDRTIVSLASSLYRRFGLRRVYYSAFLPVAPDPRLPPPAAPPLRREHRLYQADWLMRCYGYAAEEILGAAEPSLDAELDPKAAWALRNPGFFPVEVESAEYERLLRVPGLGITGARRIVAARRGSRLEAEDLGKMGIVMRRARWFLSLRGRRLGEELGPELLRPLLAEGGGAARPPSSQLELAFA